MPHKWIDVSHILSEHTTFIFMGCVVGDCVSIVLWMLMYQSRVTSQKTWVLNKTTVRTKFFLCKLLECQVTTRCQYRWNLYWWLPVQISVQCPWCAICVMLYIQFNIPINLHIVHESSFMQVLPFDDNLCVREPCLNYEECLTVLKFGNASGFIASNTVLFRPIYPVTTFACRCPRGFTG